MTYLKLGKHIDMSPIVDDATSFMAIGISLFFMFFVFMMSFAYLSNDTVNDPCFNDSVDACHQQDIAAWNI